jgi:hypothetical protein
MEGRPEEHTIIKKNLKEKTPIIKLFFVSGFSMCHPGENLSSLGQPPKIAIGFQLQLHFSTKKCN